MTPQERQIIAQVAREQGLRIVPESFERVAEAVSAILFVSPENAGLFKTNVETAFNVVRDKMPGDFEAATPATLDQTKFPRIIEGVNPHLSPELRNALGSLDLSTIHPARRMAILEHAKALVVKQTTPPPSAVSTLEAELATRSTPSTPLENLRRAHAAKQDSTESAKPVPPIPVPADMRNVSPAAKLSFYHSRRAAISASNRAAQIRAALPTLSPMLRGTAEAELRKLESTIRAGGLEPSAI
jgi:hypothetical protein